MFGISELFDLLQGERCQLSLVFNHSVKREYIHQHISRLMKVTFAVDGNISSFLVFTITVDSLPPNSVIGSHCPECECPRPFVPFPIFYLV